MILTIDVSNTLITLSAVEEGRILFTGRVSSVKTRTEDEYALIMAQLCRRNGVDPGAAEGAALSSVVPELTDRIRSAVTMITGRQPMTVGPGVKTGLTIRLDDPGSLGSDFVAAAVAAMEDCPLPCVTVDMDTAVGIGVVDGNGCYIGGVIAPGVPASAAALSRGASRLPNVSAEAPGRIICRNTEDSMKSGIIYGAAAMLDGLLTGIEEELGTAPTVVATGQYAAVVIPHCRRAGIRIDEDLVTRGLWLIYQKNHKK